MAEVGEDKIPAETCSICRDTFYDPVMAADGFCYCRNCIGVWVNGRWDWTSPLTNRLHSGPALLAPDLLRAGASLTHHREQFKQLSTLLMFQSSPYAFFGESPISTAEDCAVMLADKSVFSFVRQSPPIWTCVLLDVCWRANKLDKFPIDRMFDFCNYEKRSEIPLVQREVIRSMLEMQAARYKRSPSRRERAALLQCRSHFIWREQQVDAIYVPSGRVPTGNSLLMIRSARMCPLSLSHHLWTDASGASLSLPRLHPHMQCFSEASHCKINLPPSPTREIVYRSQCIVEPQGSALWRRRRQPPAPSFPDSGSETSSAPNPDSSDASSLMSTEASLTEATSTTPESSQQIRENLSIFEQAVWVVPQGFEYVPRVKTEHEAKDAHGTLARIDNILVTEMIGKRNRGGEGPLLQPKRRRML